MTRHCWPTLSVIILTLLLPTDPCVIGVDTVGIKAMPHFLANVSWRSTLSADTVGHQNDNREALPLPLSYMVFDNTTSSITSTE